MDQAHDSQAQAARAGKRALGGELVGTAGPKRPSRGVAATNPHSHTCTHTCAPPTEQHTRSLSRGKTANFPEPSAAWAFSLHREHLYRIRAQGGPLAGGDQRWEGAPRPTGAPSSEPWDRCPSFWKEAWPRPRQALSSPSRSLWGHRAARRVQELGAGRATHPGVSSFTGRRPLQGQGPAQTRSRMRCSFTGTTALLFIFCRLLFPRMGLGKPPASPLRHWEESPGAGETPPPPRSIPAAARLPGVAEAGCPRGAAQAWSTTTQAASPRRGEVAPERAERCLFNDKLRQAGRERLIAEIPSTDVRELWELLA